MNPLARFCLKCLLPGLALGSMPARADRAYLQPESVYAGDVTEFVIEYENSIPSLYALDLSVLDNDFIVLGKDSRVARLRESGEASHRMQWRIQIAPRRSGLLQIPAIRYGERETAPLMLEVKPEPSASEPGNRVFLELDSATREPYVGQQTMVGMRLYSSGTLIDGRLAGPRANGEPLQPSAAETLSSVLRDGQRLRVIEQPLALFPREAGELELSPASYRGTIAGTDGRRIYRQSAALKLRVRPPPGSFDGEYWLPANRLEMHQRWELDADEIRVGDSLAWTLTVVAHGLPAESLPADLLAADDPGLRIYADNPLRSNLFENGRVIGRLEQRFALIATAPGRLELPPIRLEWWDIESDRAAETRLESRGVDVVGDPFADTAESAATSPLAALWTLYRPWIQLLLMLLLLAALTIGSKSLLARLRGRIRSVRENRRLRRALKQACLANDAAAARKALVDWGRHRWPRVTIVGLRQIGAILESNEIETLLAELDVALYARRTQAWDGRHLWQRIRNAGRRCRRTGTKSPDRLPGLYQDRDQVSSRRSDQPSTGSKRSPYFAA